MNEPAKQQTRALCYACQYRIDIPGDAHSQCLHPATGADRNRGNILAVLGGRIPSIGASAIELKIRAHEHGVRRGWFNFPWNFDPVWLQHCEGFTPKPTGDDNG